MKTQRHLVRLAVVLGLSLVMSVVNVKPSSATGLITKSDLVGSWQIALNGRIGCGVVGMLVKTTLNSAGVDTNATLTTHGDCADATEGGQTFQILSLASNGSGTAFLSCGTGCGWNFTIQVAPDRSMFNLVDVNPVNPGNILSGVAIHQ